MSEPPRHVRVARLQDAQLDAVVAIDSACKQAMQRAGVSASDQPARGLAGVANLTKLHNVLVAEADGNVAGYAAWRDESPGVAYLEDIAVKPELQRLGIGTKLLDAVRSEARGVSLPVLLTRCWSKAAAGTAFLTKTGLLPLLPLLPLAHDADRQGERTTAWREEQEAAGGLAKEGQIVMMAPLL